MTADGRQQEVDGKSLEVYVPLQKADEKLLKVCE